MDTDKFKLITSNLQEVLNPEIIEEVLKKNERPLKIYWGTATTGKPHCGYFVPMLKIAEFLAAGCEVVVLLADVHGFLDALKSPIELVEQRVKYYKFVITEALKACNVSVDRLKFVIGSDYQIRGGTERSYFFDLLRLSTTESVRDAEKAGSDVVKQMASPPLSNLIYPLMQALDEEYLEVDAQFGGLDQRKIFTLASEALPHIGYAKRAHLMNPLIPGLQEGGKMSSSEPDSKIDFLDAPNDVKRKLKKAFCPPKQVEGNGVLSFTEFVILPVSALKNNGTPRFVVERRDAEPLVYSNIEEMRKDYEADVLQPQTLKPAVTEALLSLLAPIQQSFNDSKEAQEIEQKAYPPPPAKKKKEKNLGDPSRNPRLKAEMEASGAIAAKPDGSVEGPGADAANVGSSAAEAMAKMKIDEAS